MLMPSIFGENLFDDWMDFPFERMTIMNWTLTCRDLRKTRSPQS